MQLKELVYICLDLAKTAVSDDSFFTEDHVVFLLKKYRSFLLKKEKDKERGTISTASEFEQQQICLDLEKVAAIDGTPCTGGYYLRSKQTIPKLMEDSIPRIHLKDYFQGVYIVYVPRDKMRYVGTNKYLQNIIYVALGPDLHLYLNSNNPQFLYLKQVRMSALFEDFDAAASLLCDSEGHSKSCDVLDMEFPIRDYLVAPLTELVVQALTNAQYKPEDTKNDAKDNLPGGGR